MTKILFASTNAGKLREAREILNAFDVVSPKDLGIEIDVDETGETFEENALLKARAHCAASGLLTIADDSGLVVDALGGEPGVKSARYMGEDTSYEVKNAEILRRLEGAADRSARFVCAVATVTADGAEFCARGVIEGEIARSPSGVGGFGYDPIFLVPELGVTTAQLDSAAKNEISHRGKALRAIRGLLEKSF